MTAVELIHHVFGFERDGRCVEGVGVQGEGASIPSTERPPVAPAGAGRTAGRLAGPGRGPSAHPGTN